jgi:YfiH family protein
MDQIEQEQPVWIESRWPAPDHLCAGSSTRLHGFSQGEYEGLNLGDHVGDDHQAVKSNRQYLVELLDLPSEPFWLKQEHGNKIINLDTHIPEDGNFADGVFTTRTDIVCAVLTADCLPVLISNESGTEIAALHAGWRGLASGILEKALPMFSCSPESLMVWMGPAISARNYEVGKEMKSSFDHLEDILQTDTFIPTRRDHWLVSLYRIAMLILKAQGVERIHGGQYCTYRDADLFYSHRRDSGKTGRMASLIWMESEK